MYYAWWTACHSGNGTALTGNTWGWDLVGSTMIVPQPTEPGCLDEWHAVVGWLNFPVATTDYVRPPTVTVRASGATRTRPLYLGRDDRD